MNNNLILSAAVGYNFQQIEFFIKSLRRYYSGEVCFFIDENENLQKELKKYNCNIIKTNIHRNETISKRNEIFSEYLRNRDYDNVLLCDSRDIYFQGNPFEYDYKESINFFLEDYRIKDCPYNSNWLIKTYGKIAFEGISDKTILCSGTVLGTSSKIKEYLSLLKKYSSDFKYKKKFKYFITFRPDPEGRGCDQGHANYLVRKEYIKDYSFYTNAEGPVATAFYLKKILFDESSRLLNTSGKPYSVVHQYDKRWDEFLIAVNKIKENLDIT